MRYFKARLIKKTQTLTYRIYVTDSLQAIANNTGHMGGGTSVTKRYYEIFDQIRHPRKIETRTSEEVIRSLKEKMEKLKG